MDGTLPRPIHNEGGVGERFCALCKEEEGKPDETAYDMVTIRPRTGGKPRRVAVCFVHLDSLGKPASPYEIIADPNRGIHPQGSAQQGKHMQGKSEKGNANRTRRRVEIW